MAVKQAEQDLSWDEIGFICEGMSFASRPIAASTKSIAEEYSLGPRGTWILILISRGCEYPLDIANVFRIGRSLVTAELTRLADAGLIVSRRGATDGRRMELILTPAGKAVCRRVRAQLAKLMKARLAGYSKAEILLCARMLRDFRSDEDQPDFGSKETPPGLLP